MKGPKERKMEKNTVTKSLKLLQSGVFMGKLKFKSREELHERQDLFDVKKPRITVNPIRK